MFEPTGNLLELNKKSGLNILHEDFAKYLDDCDPLKEFRNEYHIPKNSDIPFGKSVIRYVIFNTFSIITLELQLM
jgi:hypothetical protein